jgi:hypothetical protein
MRYLIMETFWSKDFITGFCLLLGTYVYFI